MKNHDDNLNTLTGKEKDQVSSAQSPAELLTEMKSVGRELTPEELAAVNGGWGSSTSCPKCGGTNLSMINGPIRSYYCKDCTNSFGS